MAKLKIFRVCRLTDKQEFLVVFRKKQLLLMCWEGAAVSGLSRKPCVWASLPLKHVIYPGALTTSGMILTHLCSDKATTLFWPLYTVILSQCLGYLQPLPAFLQMYKSLPWGYQAISTKLQQNYIHTIYMHYIIQRSSTWHSHFKTFV